MWGMKKRGRKWNEEENKEGCMRRKTGKLYFLCWEALMKLHVWLRSCRVFETGPSSHLAASAVFLPLGGWDWCQTASNYLAWSKPKSSTAAENLLAAGLVFSVLSFLRSFGFFLEVQQLAVLPPYYSLSHPRSSWLIMLQYSAGSKV